VLAAKDLMSVSRYISYRDYNNTINNQFDIKQPLLPEQLQAMWNEVAKNDLLTGGTPWMNWRSEADLYRLNLNQIQIVANGRVKTYTAANGYPPKMRTLIRLAESVRLKSGQIGAPVVSGDQPSMPSTAPTTPSTGTAPESRPSVEDALTPPATAPTVPPDSAPSSAPATTKPGDQEAALPFDSDFQPIGICGNDSIFANDWEAVSASPAATTSAPATAPGR
jgi:hypothetical protein